MSYVTRMQNTSASWIGEGRLVYSTGNTPNTPFANNPALLKFRQNLSGNVTPNLPAVIQKPQYNFNFQQMISQEAGKSDFRIPLLKKSQGTPNLPVIFTGGEGGAYSNTRRAASTINLPVVARPRAITVNLPAATERAASDGVQQLEVISQTVNEVKKPSIWKSLKNGFKNIFSKAKTFFKSPKGIFTLITTTLAAIGAAIYGYVTDRFSDKNKPTPTNGPSKVFMPKLETVEQESEEVKKSEEKNTDKQETSTEVKQNTEIKENTENKQKTETERKPAETAND